MVKAPLSSASSAPALCAFPYPNSIQVLGCRVLAPTLPLTLAITPIRFLDAAPRITLTTTGALLALYRYEDEEGGMVSMAPFEGIVPVMHIAMGGMTLTRPTADRPPHTALPTNGPPSTPPSYTVLSASPHSSQRTATFAQELYLE